MLKVNEYFQGKVKSISFQGVDSPATVGVIVPGEFEFDTSKKEIMTIVSGTLEVKLPGENAYVPYKSGSSFEVAAGKVFHVKCSSDVAYLCLYY